MKRLKQNTKGGLNRYGRIRNWYLDYVNGRCGFPMGYIKSITNNNRGIKMNLIEILKEEWDKQTKFARVFVFPWLSCLIIITAVIFICMIPIAWVMIKIEPLLDKLWDIIASAFYKRRGK